ncbi:MAG: DUF4276 family protein [Deltaproteobacteria bacterium]|nr:DUF4276 family protein [Deltaproteobacteria bacterium]
MPPTKGYILVEGHGDVSAAGNLVHRLWAELTGTMPWAPPIRWKNLHHPEGIRKGGEFIRGKPDAGALLVLRDEDDACPRERGPELARFLRVMALPFPSAVVLLHPEYEVLFLPCLPSMAGRDLTDGAVSRPGLRSGTIWDGPWESRRGIKEWLSRHYPPGRSYKPTTDQLPLTRLIDFDVIRRAGLPCFGTLEHALLFLLAQVGQSSVYPPVPR